jgi:hypothetical protein
MSEDTSLQLMDLALEHGINFFDTADVYGWDQGVGLSEGVIGRWFALGGGRREKVVLSTKVYHPMSPDWPNETWPNQKGLSALHIRRACEESLRRLGTDYIDLFQMHYSDGATSWDEIWQAMEQLVREGKVLYVGSSNFAGWHIAQGNEVARSPHSWDWWLSSAGIVFSAAARRWRSFPPVRPTGWEPWHTNHWPRASWRAHSRRPKKAIVLRRASSSASSDSDPHSRHMSSSAGR